jgi:Phage protein Gp138 N-terminal domain
MAISDNPWVPGNSSNAATPPWGEIIRLYCEAKAADISVAMPCIVTVVKANNRVDLQPLLMENYKYSPAPLPLPVIQDAMVGTPRGKSWFIQMPIAPGDTGLAVFADRSIDVFSASSGVTPVDPIDSRTHSKSDAIFYPGLYPFTNPIVMPTAGPFDMVLKNGLAQLLLQPSGTFMQGNGVIETYEELVVLTTALVTMATSAAAEFTAQATASTGPLAPLAAGFTALAATFGTAATAFTAAETAFTALMGEPGE